MHPSIRNRNKGMHHIPSSEAAATGSAPQRSITQKLADSCTYRRSGSGCPAPPVGPVLAAPSFALTYAKIRLLYMKAVSRPSTSGGIAIPGLYVTPAGLPLCHGPFTPENTATDKCRPPAKCRLPAPKSLQAKSIRSRFFDYFLTFIKSANGTSLMRLFNAVALRTFR